MLSYTCNVLFIIFWFLSLINSQKIEISWNEIIRVTKTTPTLQIVPNPLMERKSLIHDRIYKEIEDLKVDYVRYVPWFPYPKLYIPELDPPTANTTSWNFTLMDPMFEDFMNTQKGRQVVINYSAIPEWMFKIGGTKQVPYPENPDVLDWSYLQGTELVDPSLKQLSEYFERIVSWYVKGEFTDENGKQHVSGHKYNIDYWEVLNEVDYEHKTTPKQYTERYDAIVSAIKKVSPKTKFVGLVLNNPNKVYNEFVPYFLNASNHKSNIPLDAISYHFYAQANKSDTIQTMQHNFFSQANTFLETTKSIEKIRKALSPNTITMINEIGTMNDMSNKTLNNTTYPLPKEFMNLSAALYAYVFAELSKLGIEVAAESQYVGYPKPYVFYPSLTMLDWNTGAPNCRFNVLRLIFDNFGPGDSLVNTTIIGSDNIHATGFVTKSGQKKLLLLNKHLDSIEIKLTQLAARTSYIDINTNDLIKTLVLNKNSVTLDGFAVHVISF